MPGERGKSHTARALESGGVVRQGSGRGDEVEEDAHAVLVADGAEEERIRGDAEVALVDLEGTGGAQGAIGEPTGDGKGDATGRAVEGEVAGEEEVVGCPLFNGDRAETDVRILLGVEMLRPPIAPRPEWAGRLSGDLRLL